MDLVSYCSLDETRRTDYSTANPLNREPPLGDLVASFITPSDLSYDRNHGPIPHISADKHSVLVDGHVSQHAWLSIDQLRSEFPQHEVECALECAGNRRHTMRTMLKEVDGIDWGDAAVMNCRWKGPRLRDILLAVGVKDSREKNVHVAFASYQVKVQNDDWFEGSIPLERCMTVDGEAILALEMNGSPIPPSHGYPVRAVLPGVSGARWVKWLDRIRVQDFESANFYQQRDYKVLPPAAIDKASAEKLWDKTPAMYDMPINSVVAVPGDNDTVSLPSSGILTVKGYALPNGTDGPVTQVQVSIDGGRSWLDAELGRYRQRWCWVLWEVAVCPQPGTNREILCRAFDAGGNSQMEHSQWNFRGVGYNGYGRTRNLTILGQ